MRLTPRAEHDVPWYLKPFFWNQRRKYGKALDAALLWARSPKLFLGVALLYGMIDRRSSPIDPALRSLVTVRVSQLNGCGFCVDLNSAALLKRGATPEKVTALASWRESDLFDAREAAALDFAEAMTLCGAGVQDWHVEACAATSVKTPSSNSPASSLSRTSPASSTRPLPCHRRDSVLCRPPSRAKQRHSPSGRGYTHDS